MTANVDSQRGPVILPSVAPNIALDAGSTFTIDDGDAWVVLRGLVVVRVLDPRGEDAFVQLRRGPCYVGLERMVGTAQHYELSALTDIELQRLPAEELTRLSRDLSPEGERLVQLLGRALVSCIEDRIAMSGTSTIKVARLLTADQAIPFNRVPRRVWANVLGMRAETLSRTLRELGEADLIRVERDRVTVIDREGLSRLASSPTH